MIIFSKKVFASLSKNSDEEVKTVSIAKTSKNIKKFKNKKKKKE